MTNDVKRWFAESECGLDYQDFDLVLADPALLPEMHQYLANVSGSRGKKIEIICALLELLKQAWAGKTERESRELIQQIQTLIKAHVEIAKEALTSLGPVDEVILRKVLQLAIPEDFPQWVEERANEHMGTDNPDRM
jgi:hypothetical protein